MYPHRVIRRPIRDSERAEGWTCDRKWIDNGPVCTNPAEEVLEDLDGDFQAGICGSCAEDLEEEPFGADPLRRFAHASHVGTAGV